MKQGTQTGLRITGAALVLAVAILCAVYLWHHLPRPPGGPGTVAGVLGATGGPAYGTVPDFTFTDHRGRIIGRTDLLGEVWVADFIFTRCAGICPVMTTRMKQLLEAVGSTTDLRLVSFSVDPEYDTPEVLAAYASRFEAEDERWHFLTGDRDTIHELSREGFRLAVGDVSDEEIEAGAMAVMHSDRFALVDRRGRIRGLYRGAGPESESAVRQLAEDIRELVADTPSIP